MLFINSMCDVRGAIACWFYLGDFGLTAEISWVPLIDSMSTDLFYIVYFYNGAQW